MSASTLSFLANNGYLVLFLVTLVDQAGLPLPAAPVLLAAGVMVRNGLLRPEAIVPLAMLASLIGHGAWYLAGRRHGVAIIRLLCRVSLEPSACVRRTEELFKHVGPLSLLWVRFIPGLDVIAQPMVALAGMPLVPYIAMTLFGSALWSTILLVIGYALGHASPWDILSLAGRPLLVTAGCALGAYLLYKLAVSIVTNTRDVPRLTPQALQQLRMSGQPLLLIDLRTRSELKKSGQHIPGALHLTRRALRQLTRTPQSGVAAVMLCECPKEAGSAFIAAIMRRHGWRDTWALAGGFSGWRKVGMPTTSLGSSEQPIVMNPEVPAV